MKNKFDPKAFVNDPAVKPLLDSYADGHNFALEWAANWIENSAKINGHPAAQDFAANMVMTFRAALMKRRMERNENQTSATD
jgi:hypothetical protein